MGLRTGPGTKEVNTGSPGLFPDIRAKGEVLGVSILGCQDSKGERNLEENNKLRKENAFGWRNSNGDVGMVMVARG